MVVIEKYKEKMSIMGSCLYYCIYSVTNIRIPQLHLENQLALLSIAILGTDWEMSEKFLYTFKFEN